MESLEVVGTVKTENDGPYSGEIVILSITDDEDGRFYLDAGDISIGIDIPDLLRFIGRCMHKAAALP